MTQTKSGYGWRLASLSGAQCPRRWIARIPRNFYTSWEGNCNDRNVASQQAVVIVHLTLKGANRRIELVFWRVLRRVFTIYNLKILIYLRINYRPLVPSPIKKIGRTLSRISYLQLLALPPTSKSPYYNSFSSLRAREPRAPVDSLDSLAYYAV